MFQSNRDAIRNENIYVMNADGTGVTRLTTERSSNPKFSSDGSKIVFVSWRAPNFAICVMNADGTGVKFLTDGKARDTSPTTPLSQKT